jgi:hypothetical protein
VKKLSLILGIIYFFIGVLGIVNALRFIGTGYGFISLETFVIPGVILLCSILEIGTYFLNFKNRNIYLITIVLGIIVIAVCLFSPAHVPFILL